MNKTPDLLGGWNGAGCILCPITDNPQRNGWWGADPGVIEGTEAVVIFRGDSLCYKHFLEIKGLDS